MNAEKYVNDIIKNVKCSKIKKSEIREQLLSDIHVRMDNGETLELIMEDMGTPGEISEEFNQNLTESEKKAYKKRKIIKIAISITAVILIILLSAISYVRWLLPKVSEMGSSGIFSQEVVEEKAKDIVMLLDQNDFDSLKAESIEEMQAILVPESFEEPRNLIGDDWGQMESFGTIYTFEFKQQGQTFVMAQVNVSYENVKVIYSITFDKDMKLAGIYMR
ncbi:MAG: DUF3887 domain-containing protein [Lachnospiraceae bacterium]|nr:DUF3887 domain-containing protein [Lachnospiraceae bacterium]